MKTLYFKVFDVFEHIIDILISFDIVDQTFGTVVSNDWFCLGDIHPKRPSLSQVCHPHVNNLPAMRWVAKNLWVFHLFRGPPSVQETIWVHFDIDHLLVSIPSSANVLSRHETCSIVRGAIQQRNLFL